MYLINPNEPNLNLISSRAPSVQIQVKSGLVGPQGTKFGSIQVAKISLVFITISNFTFGLHIGGPECQVVPQQLHD